MTAPDTTPTRPDGASETLGDAANTPAPSTTDALDRVPVDAARFAFLRAMFLREPKVNAWGQPTYGVVLHAPHELNAGEFDRMIDALRAADDGSARSISVQRDLVEATTAAVSA